MRISLWHRRSLGVACLVVLVALVSASCAGASRATIHIGLTSTCRGTVSTFYEESVAGAELPFIERGARPLGARPSDGITSISIAGKRIDLVLGCSFAGSDVTALGELRRLVEQRGAKVLVAAPALTDGDARLVAAYAHDEPGITFFGGDPRSPTSNMFRFNPDSPQAAAGLGAYAYHVLGWRTAATIGEDDSFGWPIVAGFVAEFCALGGTVVKRVWTPFDESTWAPLVRRLPPGIDGVALMAGLQGTGGFFAAYRKLQPDLPRHVVMSAYPLAIGGRAPAGVVAAGYLPLDSNTSSWRRYVHEFRAAFPQYAGLAGGSTDIYDYDHVEAVLRALQAARGDLSDGERRFRSALERLRLPTPVGTVRLDRDHRVVGPNFLMRVRGRLDAPVIKTIPGVDVTLGGTLSATTPPTRTQPVCRAGHVPPWAR